MKEHEKQLYLKFLWWIPCIKLILGESEKSSSEEVALESPKSTLPQSNVETNLYPREDRRFR